MIPLFFSLGLAVLFYPGFMSYDTIHALRGARNGVTDSIWPPMVSYVWRVVDIVSLNPSAMHFSQISLLCISIYYIVILFTSRIRYAVIFLLIYLSIPAILGTVAVIWKDVLMSAFFLFGFMIIVAMKFVINRWGLVFLLLLAVFSIFLGICSRHNAITGAVPLLFYFAFVVCGRFLKRPLSLWIGVIILGLVLNGLCYIMKIQLDTYSLPNFERFSNNNTESFIRPVQVLDIAGASICVGSNLFADAAPGLSLKEIKKEYDPRHINLSKGLLKKVVVDKNFDKIWLNVALHHPICFLYNKFQVMRYLIGANKGDQFLITSPSIESNEYGYSLPKSSLRESVVNYIVCASRLLLFRPWFLYLVSIASFIYLIISGFLKVEYLTLYLSGILYFAGIVMFGNAADARLPFYTTSAFAIVIFVAVIEFLKKMLLKKNY